MEIFGIGFSFLLLIAGIILTAITIFQMCSGRLSLPGWAKVLLSAAMILMLIVTLIGMLPPIEVHVTNPFVSEETHFVTPVDPSTNNDQPITGGRIPD